MAAGEIHIELAVNFAEDPKLRSLLRYGPEVRGLRDLYVLMICYCKRNLTDGFVPLEEIGLMVYPDSWENGQRDAKRMAEVGLLLEVDGGYMVAAYVKRNRTKAEVLQLLQDKAVGGSLGNHKRWHEAKGIVKPDCRHCHPELDPRTDRTSDRSWDRRTESGASEGANRTDPGEGANQRVERRSRTGAAEPTGDRTDPARTDTDEPADLFGLVEQGASHPDRTTDSHTDRGASRVRSPKTETETETDRNNPPTPQGGKRRRKYDYNGDPAFTRFWEEYPVKEGKPSAFTAWQAALQRGMTPDDLIQAARKFRLDPNRNPRHTKYPQGWLNDERYAKYLTAAGVTAGEDRERDERDLLPPWEA